MIEFIAPRRFPDQLTYRGYAAPSRVEADVYDLEVEGEIPAGLRGCYYRNSADPRFPPRLGTDIFLNGDGMIHKLQFGAGYADLRTRYVRTEKFQLERAAHRALFGAYRNPYTDDVSVAGKDRGTGNTSLLWHGGRLLALKEDSRPIALDPDTLATLGSWDFNGRLHSQTFTAHPKLDPLTGEVIAFAYNTQGRASREIELFWIDRSGALTRTERFDAPYASMVHDFLVSRNHIAFVFCPMINDWERVQRGAAFFHWDSELPTVVAIMPRAAGVSALRWYQAPRTVMQTHAFNAWEQDSVLHLDHFISNSGWLSQFPDIRNPDAREHPPYAQRWSFDLAGSEASFSIARLFDHIGEMPVVDPRHLMSRTQHYYFGTNNPQLGPLLDWGPKGPPFTCLGHFDAGSGKLDFYYAGPQSAPEEPCFVPKHDAAPEGDGWLLSMVGRRAENRTDLVILDSLDLAAGPVATLRLPLRLHEGFHGIWVPAG
jgi:carotenoid cleavage dioxygenase